MTATILMRAGAALIQTSRTRDLALGVRFKRASRRTDYINCEAAPMQDSS